MLNTGLKIVFRKRAVSCSCLLILYPVPMFTYHVICQDSVLLVELSAEWLTWNSGGNTGPLMEGVGAAGSSPGFGWEDNSLKRN